MFFNYFVSKDLSENKLGADGAESVKDILLHNSNITRFVANGEHRDHFWQDLFEPTCKVIESTRESSNSCERLDVKVEMTESS